MPSSLEYFEKMLCLRFDVDSLGDCGVLPQILSRLRHYNAKATFFITTGCDRAFLNFPRYVKNPLAFWRKRVYRRFGLCNLAVSALKARKIEEFVDFGDIRTVGEVSLHGYEHTLWIKDFKKLGIEGIRERIEQGLAAFKKTAGFQPVGFASPGFTMSDELLVALEDFSFKYSSDSFGTRVYYPVVQGVKLRTPQVPVMIDLEEIVETLGLEKFIKYLKARIKSAEKPIVAYMHPSYCRVNSSALEKVLETAEGSFVTFGELVEENEDSAHI